MLFKEKVVQAKPKQKFNDVFKKNEIPSTVNSNETFQEEASHK